MIPVHIVSFGALGVIFAGKDAKLEDPISCKSVSVWRV